MTHHNEEQANEVDDNMKKVIEAGSVIKMFGGWVFGVVTVIISVILWIQTQGDDKYYPKLAGENLEKQMTRYEQKLDNLENGNREIIRLLGKLEANQENNK